MGTGEDSKPQTIWHNLRYLTISYNSLNPLRAVEYAVNLGLQEQHLKALVDRFPNLSEVELCEYIRWNYTDGRWKPRIRGDFRTLYEYLVHEKILVKEDDWWREQDRDGILEDILRRPGPVP
jgi:hypothetical protein